MSIQSLFTNKHVRAGASVSARRGVLSAALPVLLVLAAGAVALDVPPLTGRVVDRAGLLTAVDAGRVEQAIRALEQRTGGQMAVLILPSLQGDALEPFSIRVAEAWKIGRKAKDDGAILIVSRDDRKIRLEIGYGWEGSINDARAGDIIRDMGPFFRGARYADGIVYAVAKVRQFVTGEAGVLPTPPQGSPHRSDSVEVPLIVIIVAIVIILLLVLVMGRFGRGMTFSSGGSSGGWGGGGGGGGGFSGGGGSFGGGGASGSW